MRVFPVALVAIPIFCVPTVLGDLPGPGYPAPRDISSNSSLVAASWKNVADTLDKAINGEALGEATSILLKNTTFSLGMFSLHDANAPSMQYHHTSSPNLNKTIGTKKVDSDSIYRIASISKLITTYVGMIELEENDWNTPLTKIYPAFKDFAHKSAQSYNLVNDIKWDKITVGDLAAQLGGIPRLSIPISADFVVQSVVDPSILDSWGLPPFNMTEAIAKWPCAKYFGSGDIVDCTPQEVAQGISASPPRYLPAASPLYSDAGFFLLGGALANITGISMDDLYRKSIFEPLGLESTFSIPPSDKNKDILARTVVPNNPAIDLQNFPVTTPSGGIFSSIKDLSKIGVSILNSTLLSIDRKNRWLKPVSFAGDLRYAVGRPWEIYRYVHEESGAVTDIYTKLGDSGNYCGLLVVIPDFDIGFTMLGAGPEWVPTHTKAIQLVADLLTDSLMPALMRQARKEAMTNLVGTYKPRDDKLNTTLTLSVPHSSHVSPGLIITKWISNGTDLTNLLPNTLLSLISQAPNPLPKMSPNGVRLVPTIQDVAGSGQIAFQMETVNPTGPVNGRLFSQMYNVGDWAAIIDQPVYRDIPINEFVFNVDKKTGKAHSVMPKAYNVKLERVN